MGLGGTAKKLQKVTNAAEELYTKMNEVIGQLKELREEVEHTSEQVDRIEYDVAEQRAVLEAIADAQGLDVDEVLAAADLPPDPDAEPDDADGEAGENGENGDGTADGAETETAADDAETDTTA